MTERGVVREWHADEGWGVVDTTAAPGGCWVHYSTVLMAGFRALEAGQVVDLDLERMDQDGFAFRSVEVRPSEVTPPPPDPGQSGGAAYRSTLTISYDDGTTLTSGG